MSPDPPEFEAAVYRFARLWWQNSETDPDDVARAHDPGRAGRARLVAVLAARKAELSEQLSRICGRFSDAWRAARGGGPRPRIEDVLRDECRPEDPPEKRTRLFFELFVREYQLRVRTGDRPARSEYQARFPKPPFPQLTAAGFDRCTQAFSWRFRVIGKKPFAGGGEAGLWHGFDDLLGREVAIKRVRNPDEASRLRLRREARTLARLADTGVPAVYAVGDDEDGLLCLAEHLIRGPRAGELAPTFAAVIADFRATRTAPSRRNPVFLDAVAKLIAVCRTIAAAHRHPFGILHRDLSPRNVVLDDLGRPFVVDWGLAVWLEREQVEAAYNRTEAGEMTMLSRVAGTPGYLSPEQAVEAADPLTRAADVFTLGACLFHLTAGVRVYDCTTPRWKLRGTRVRPAGPPGSPAERDLLVARARGYATAPNPRAADRRADPELCAIARTALARFPADRFRDAGVLAEALEDWIRDNPPRHRAGTWLRRRRFGFGRSLRRNPGRYLGVIAVLILAGTAAGLAAAGVQPVRGWFDRVGVRLPDFQAHH